MTNVFHIVFVMEYLFKCSGTGDIVLRSVLLKVFTGNVSSDWNENILKEVNNFNVVEREKERLWSYAFHIANCFLLPVYTVMSFVHFKHRESWKK